MTRDVIIRIKGLQMAADLEEDETEVITAGVFFEKNGRCYVKYDEVTEGFSGTISNLLKFDEERLEVTKRGLTNVNMVFEKGQRNYARYQTPFGSLTMGIQARRMDVCRLEDEIRIETEYDLEVNYEHLAECSITIDIRSKDKKEAHLLT